MLELDATGYIHFWFSNLEGVRAELFPRLTRAYASWHAGDGGQALTQVLSSGRSHWLDLGHKALRLFAHRGTAATPEIRRLLESAAARL